VAPTPAGNITMGVRMPEASVAARGITETARVGAICGAVEVDVDRVVADLCWAMPVTASYVYRRL
jgi:hypothetical protein